MPDLDPAAPAGPADLLAAAVAADPARPAVTFYDDATGERVELSVATLDNWVAKTANLLVDDLQVEPGDPVAVRLPAHWLAPVWLLAAWRVGAVVHVGAEPTAAAVVVRPDDALPADATTTGPAADGPAGQLVAVSLRPLAAPGPPPPAEVLDYAREVLAHGDRYARPPIPPAAPALAADTAGAVLDGAGVVAAARDLLAGVGLAGGRVQTGREPADVAGAALLGVAPVLLPGGLVLVRHLDPARDAERRRAERVDATV